jgi:apolipoprotein D and lipocalin family protein
VSTARPSSLVASIAVQERRVADVDHRLSETIARVRQRVCKGRGRAGGVLAIVAGPVLCSWIVNRLRRRRRGVPPPRTVARPDRFATVLDSVLPMLVPAIGANAAAILSVLAALPREQAQRPPAVVERVDLNLYAGTWHEIASLPGHHERECVAAAVTTTYLPDGAGLRVINRCRRADGRYFSLRGRARVVDRRSRAKLKVSLVHPLLGWLPWAWADYWILDLSPDYRRALVGSPDRRHLWILARESMLSRPEYRSMLLIAAAKGYDTQLVRQTTPASVG